MNDKKTEDLKLSEEYEKIRQVPLEEMEDNRAGWPVGASYMGNGDAGRKVDEGHREYEELREFRSRRRGSLHSSDKSGRAGTQAGRGGEAGGERGVLRVGTPAVNAVSIRARNRRREIRGGQPLMAVFMALVIGLIVGFGSGYYLWGLKRPNTVDLTAVEVPRWVEQSFIRKNIFSRPDVSRKAVNNIVIHYVANPGTTAAGNRSFFDGLADQDPEQGDTFKSSHFIVGLEGEVVQCIPIDEIAYANGPRNEDTVSIEVCHPDETGKFNDATYESVVRLSAWLCDALDLSAKDLLRHYDVNGKDCPRYYVAHEDAWKQLKSDVAAAVKEKAWEQ